MNDINLITTLLLVFLTAVTGGLIAKKIKVPTIVGYIVAGFIVGSLNLEFIRRNILETVANAGVTLLLFTLGVEFSFRRLRTILRMVTWAASAQIMLTMVVICIVLILLSVAIVPALFLSAAAALSSTAVVFKVLSERGQVDTVSGEATTGWLVVQDLAVIPMMFILSAFVTLWQESSLPLIDNIGLVILSLGKSALVLGVVVLLGRVGLARVISVIAKAGSRELFLVATVGLVILSAGTTYALGLPAPLGAFIAGLLIAETSQNHAVFAEIRPLRDVFATIFFVSLGMALPIGIVRANFAFIFIFAVGVMILKWIIVNFLMRFLEYHRKSAFLTALALTQMSEFGFIISKEGIRIGALTSDQGSILTATTIMSMLLSLPLISAGYDVYRFYTQTMSKWLPKLFPEGSEQLAIEQYPIARHVVICGYGRVGKYVGRALLMAKIPFLVVDYNQATVSDLKKSGIPVVFGDPAEKAVLDFAQVDLARAVVIAIPDRHTQELIISHALTLNQKIKIICRTHHEEDQPRLKSLGVQTVIQPEFEAAVTISEKLLAEFGTDEEGIAGKVSRLKIEHGIG